MNNYSDQISNQIKNLLDISIALSSEEDYNKVLEMILTEARKITKADAGTIFLREADQLKFKISHNDSLGIYKGASGEKIDLPKVPISKESVSGYVAQTKKTINVEDVYHAASFDFSSPKEYDQKTGYRTRSMLVVPMVDHRDKVIGVLQLINAQNKAGEIIKFSDQFEKVIKALASQAAISLSNSQHLADIQNLLNSFIKVMATMIDQRSPYNADHTYRIVKRVEKIADLIDQADEGAFAEVNFGENRKRQLVMAAWLHDIGKIVVPLSVINKETRLGGKLPLVLQRFAYIQQRVEVQYLEKKNSNLDSTEVETWYNNRLQKITEARQLIKQANNPDNFVDQAMIDQLRKIADLTYETIEGEEKNWLTDKELEELSIQKGTLTAAEKELMQEHVEFAADILEYISFPERLEKVPDWIMLHHERLDGSGYPKGLAGDEIVLEGRILALMDVFDALTASDRPYKEGMDSEQALSILEEMVEENKLDRDVFELVKESNIDSYVQEARYDFFDLQEVRVD